MRYFTHYWSNSIVDYALDSEEEEAPLDYTAGDSFTESGLMVGDVVYVINALRGEVYLVGRMQVGEIVHGRSNAWRKLKHRAWAAEEHLIAARGSGTPQYFSRALPMDVARNIRFIDDAGPGGPLFKDERIEKKSVRGFREIDPETARLFDEMLAMPIGDDRDYDYEDQDEDEDDADGVSDGDLNAITSQYDNAELIERVSDAAMTIITREMEKQGYRFMGRMEDAAQGYNLAFLDGEERLSVIAKGVVDSEAAFLISEYELAALESDTNIRLAVVTRALSREPVMAVWNAEEFFDEFAMRPILYAAKKVD